VLNELEAVFLLELLLFGVDLFLFAFVVLAFGRGCFSIFTIGFYDNCDLLEVFALHELVGP